MLDFPAQPQAWARHSWSMLVHMVNSPEGKESHDTQGHQQLNQQNGIDLATGRGSSQLRGACWRPGGSGPQPRSGGPSFLVTRSTLQTRILCPPPSIFKVTGKNPGQEEKRAKTLHSLHPWDLERRDQVFRHSRGWWVPPFTSRYFQLGSQ